MMSRNLGEEIYLKEIEVAILRVFIQYKLFEDYQIITVLKELIEKLGKYGVR